MNALFAAASLALAVVIIALVPDYGAPAVLVCAVCAAPAALLVSRAGENRDFLLRLFFAALLARVFVGTIIFYFNLQDFFGGDAYTYDFLGLLTARMWRGEMPYDIYQSLLGPFLMRNYGMIYVNASIYAVVGQNMLAVQFVNAVAGAATAPIIYQCARQIFGSQRVARNSSLFVAFFPSLILWSSQGLKDGPIVLLLALCVLATLKLDERFSAKYLVALAASLVGVLSLRFYVFYMMVAAVGASFVIGVYSPTLMGYVRRFAALTVVALALLQFGVLGTAGKQFETYGNLDMLQRSRADQADSAKSGFATDIDVSTAGGALTVIPVGMTYLLFAPFPWQLASLRQSITLPEMVVWWCSFPLLCAGLWFTLRHRMRQALPVLIFTMMLTIAYSVFQGNVGTAYRQRSQLLIFYFIFVSVGYELMRERRAERAGAAASAGAVASASPALVPRYEDDGRGVAALLPPQPPVLRARSGLAAEPERLRAKREMYAAVRADFLSCPGATEADFERLWPSLRDEIFKQGAYRALARWSPHFAQSLPETQAYAEIGDGALAD
jgi:hypothetical protein